jgi:hypothetical protein
MYYLNAQSRILVRICDAFVPEVQNARMGGTGAASGQGGTIVVAREGT